MDDVRAVMDAVGSERAAVLGWSEGAPLCALFAATYPQRTTALVMYGGVPRFVSDGRSPRPFVHPGLRYAPAYTPASAR
jgi:pimeloyl-ACP methyl ester carboxylesterase